MKGRNNIYKAWVALQSRDMMRAQKELKHAHDSLQNHVLYHPICHLMMAVSHAPHPIRMTKEIYLGIMAPWGTIRRNIRTKKRRRA